MVFTENAAGSERRERKKKNMSVAKCFKYSESTCVGTVHVLKLMCVKVKVVKVVTKVVTSCDHETKELSE